MAVRSGAGVGVVVSLVVFVITTICLLVLSIVFYAGQQNERELAAEANAARDKYADQRDRNADYLKQYETAAGGRSVISYMHQRHQDTMRFVGGDAQMSTNDLQSQFAEFGASQTQPVIQVMRNTMRDVRSLESDLDAKNRSLQSLEADLRARNDELDRVKASHAQEIEAVQAQIGAYRSESERLLAQVTQSINEIEEAKERLRDRYENRINDLNSENDELGQEVQRLQARINEFEKILQDIRVRATDPDLLVDGRVIDVSGSNDEIYINRGRDDRIVLGMTFEVYDDAGSIRPDAETGTVPRGKASLQVIRVGDTTSVCKVTRSVPGRPVVRNNVIANSIYDPDYQFKFLVHGKFDVDGDGRPSEAEAEYLRRLVTEWGGSVVYAEQLPGDLDFLVLGEEPPMPPPLRDDATEYEIRVYLQRRQAKELYDRLFRQAREAQIPVVNANRFFVLIGHTAR
jgi:uncharacterized protein YeeX (DUF496 family)